MTELKHEELLHKLFVNTNDWLKFAEAKNLGLLTISAGFVFGISQIPFQEGSPIKIVCYYIFIPLIVFSFLSSLLSLLPILSYIERGNLWKSGISKLSHFIDNETEFENIHYYGYIQRLNEIEFESKFLSKINSIDSFSVYEKELSTQIIYNSRITWLKYQLFKIGAFFFLIALMISVVTLPIISLMKYHFI